MTLRQALGGDTQHLYDLLEKLLDEEDGVIVLFDGDRAVTCVGGFGLSPSQHELIALDIERVARTAGATKIPRRASSPPSWNPRLPSAACADGTRRAAVECRVR